MSAKKEYRMLNDRKKQILQAIIEEYIQTAEPVSSNGIVQKYGLNYSSATVRNEMASLEKEGFLDKPLFQQNFSANALHLYLYA